MSVGIREEPEKRLDSKIKPKAFKRLSRKKQKVAQNRKVRRIVKNDPEAPPLPKYCGHEW